MGYVENRAFLKDAKGRRVPAEKDPSGKVLRWKRDPDRPCYWLRLWVDGKRVDVPAKTPSGVRARTKEEAKAILREMERAALRDELGVLLPRKGPGLTVAELVTTFLRDYRSPKVKDRAKYRRDSTTLLGHATDLLGKKPAESLAAGDVEKLRDHLLDEGFAKQSVINVLNRLGRAYEWAIARALLRRRDNPVKRVARPSRSRTTEPLEPDRFLSREECAKLLRYARVHQPDDAPFFATALLTGCRYGELAALTWADVLFDLGQIHIPRAVTKTSTGRVAEIGPELRPWLDEWRKRPWHKDRSLVFGTPEGKPRHQKVVWKALQKALVGAGVRRVRLHDLRHTFASLAVMAGVPLLTVARALGHASIDMVQRYAHLSPEHRAAAAAAVRIETDDTAPEKKKRHTA